MICCPTVLGSEMSLPQESIVSDVVLRGDWFGASLLQPRAFESMVCIGFFVTLCPAVVGSGTSLP